MNRPALSLKEYLDGLQAAGRYWFTTEELIGAVSLKEASLSVALSRMAKQGLVLMIKRGFGIILYPKGKELHPTYYMDAMMTHMKAEYYVALLSASSYWGASHQSSMVYQVVVDKVITPLAFESSRVEFVVKKKPLNKKWVKRVAGVGGYVQMSSPELTAIDLLRFPDKAGHLNNVATVLSDLAEKWDGRTMTALCSDLSTPTTTLQRFGYILDDVLKLRKEAGYVESAMIHRVPGRQVLSQAKKVDKKNNAFNGKWSLFINTKVEPD
jgi:predicted transcriptional regulator of viral defense system